MRFIHLTDPHLTSLGATSFSAQRGKRALGYLSWKRRRQYVHLRDVLDQTTQAIKAEQPDQILITGDLVHICLPDEIEQARLWLESFGTPDQITLVPGNHDIYQSECWRNIAGLWGDYLGLKAAPTSDLPADSYPQVKQFGSFNLISLSSSEAMPVFSARGRLGDQQLKALQNTLVSLSGQPSGWLIHHPPLPGLTGKRRALSETRALENLIKQYQPVFVLYGHNHRNVETLVKQTRVLGTASASSKYDASFRVIDVSADDKETTVTSSLRQRDPVSGEFSEIDGKTWNIC